MNVHAIAFEGLNLAIVPLWFGLLFFPRKRWVTVAIDCFVIAAASLFVVNLVPGLSEVFPVVLKPTLGSVGALLAAPQGSLGAWTHFVIGDLWAGRWIGEDGHREGIPRAVVAAILVLTLLLGPVGLLAYFLTKLALRRRLGWAN